ncbi:MAG TPA: DMT family transporter [Flavobacteriaceae bacterium]|nr:DMT family transporter [Flavobacteriaceae bacterium]
MLNDRVRNHLHLHLIVFIWGFTAILGALITIGAEALVWYRMSIAVILMFIYTRFIKKENLALTPKELARFLLGGILISSHWLAFFLAIKVSNVSVTLATLSTGAFFASILEPIFYRRRIVYYEILFGLLVIIGLYTMFRVETEYGLGIALALLAALLSASFSILNGKLIQEHKASVISLYEIGFGVVCLSIYMAFTGGFNPSFFEVSLSDWTYLLILGSVCTAYAFIASVHVMRWISPYTVMLTINLEPVYGILMALVIFGDEESMSSSFYLGAAIILITVILNGVLKNRLERKRGRIEQS